MNKIIFFILLTTSIMIGVNAQNVGIGIAVPDASAKLHISDANRGLLIPNVSVTSVFTAAPVTTPATGLLVWNTNASVTGGSGVGFYYWNGTIWVRLQSSDSEDWDLKGNAGTTAGTNFLGTTDSIDLVVKTDNTERMRVLAGGNVGVGISLPTGRLHVYEPNASAVGLQIGKSNDDDALNILVNNTIGGVGNGLDIDFNSNTTASSALWIKNRGDFAALNIDNYGDAMGVQIWNRNLTSPKSALTIHNESFGKGIYMDALATNTDTLAYIKQKGTGMGMYLFSDGNGVDISATDFALYSYSVNQHGVYGYSSDANLTSRSGVYGRSAGLAGVTGSNGSGSTYGVYSFGDIGSSGVKLFVIDHPLDPENKMLKHFCIESDEPMLIYRDKVILDQNGEAIVQLKDYIAAINRNYTYNLTPIGQFQQVYIAEEVNEEGKFKIAGGMPNGIVSWTIYGERNDAYFKSNPDKRLVEVPKENDQKGKYLDPESHNKPVSLGIDYSAEKDQISVISRKAKRKDHIHPSLSEQ